MVERTIYSTGKRLRASYLSGRYWARTSDLRLVEARLRDAGVRATQRRHGSLIHGFINMAPVNRASHDASCEMAGVLRGALGG